MAKPVEEMGSVIQQTFFSCGKQSDLLISNLYQIYICSIYMCVVIYSNQHAYQIIYMPHEQCWFSTYLLNLYWLVVYLPLWKIWKSVGMIIPNIWKVKKHVPNHQSIRSIFFSYVINIRSYQFYINSSVGNNIKNIYTCESIYKCVFTYVKTAVYICQT
jgi:hypothetical protein